MISSVLNHLTGLFGTLHHRLVNLRQLPLLTILHRQYLDVAFHEAGIMVFLATSCRVFSALRLISSSGVTYMSCLTSLLLLFLSIEKSPILYQFAQEKYINLIFLRLFASYCQIFCIFAGAFRKECKTYCSNLGNHHLRTESKMYTNEPSPKGVGFP